MSPFDSIPLELKTGTETGDVSFSLFDALTFICLEELQRFGKRKSCRSIDILHMMERMAAAGTNGELFKALQRQAVECLETKMVEGDSIAMELEQNGVLNSLRKGDFGLHSHRTLLWVWRFSTRQRKQRAFLKSAAKHYESGLNKDSNALSVDRTNSNANSKEEHFQWREIFDDPTRPLVIDIGCGMGISILGLATLQGKGIDFDNNDIDLNWSDCNFLGADLSRLAIGFGTSILHRWNLKGRLHFEVSSAQDILEKVCQSYPGDVKMIMIQFPTPFRMNQGDDPIGNGCREQKIIHVPDDEVRELASVVNQGNQQLPTNAFDGFMVTTQLLDAAYNLLQKSSGKLLLQSNCEDVAVLMRNMAVENVGFQSFRTPFPVQFGEVNCNIRIPRRTEQWIALGGERAEGNNWSSKSFIPAKGATETEISCILNATPVHRCIVYP